MRDSDPAYARYVQVNLPHARTVIRRIRGALETLGALGGDGDAGAPELQVAQLALEEAVAPYDEDPAFEAALRTADEVAERARVLVRAILASSARGDRLGQHVRNLFECLGLPEEGGRLSLECGERPDSLLR